jgi:RNA polymerase sigma-70 factor (ECF subfamily)
LSETATDLERLLREGDVEALAALFALHRPRLRRSVQFRLDPRIHGRVDPDDVLQEAYLAAAQRLEHFLREPGLSPFLWLRLIVNQTLVDVYRRHLGAQMRDAGRELAIDGLRYTQSTSASLVIQLAGSLSSPSRVALKGEIRQTLEQSIENMDPIDREILALRHFEELSNAEVAEALGIQQKAASIRYVRAVRRLKDVLSRIPGFLDEAQKL